MECERVRSFKWYRLAITLLTLSGVPAAATAQAPSAKRATSAPVARAPGVLEIRVAVVDSNANVKPIPLHGLTLRPLNDSSRCDTVATALDGRATKSLPAGGYALESLKAVFSDGTRYRWRVVVQSSAGRVTTVELTNANALVDTAAVVGASGSSGRQVAPEMQVYGRVRQGVFRVQAGLSQGTGFLVDSSGLVLTNAHVIAGVGDGDVSVYLDTLTRVPAYVVARAQEADLALLRIHPDFARGRPLPTLDGTAEPQVGERVFALGYPLGQDLTLTSGIVSSVRDGAVISDVNINQGNSGGPMYALDGSIVAVNAFLNAGDYGPGLSGAIAIERALPLLKTAVEQISMLPLPGTEALPVLPRVGLPAVLVKSTVAATPGEVWESLAAMSVGRFRLAINTPFQVVARRMAFEADVGKDRKKREAKSGVQAEESYSELRDIYDWDRYTRSGAQSFTPVVGIAIAPKIGETTGSFLRRLAVAAAARVESKATIRYKSDLRSATFYRNGEKVTPYMGGTQPVKQYVNDAWIDMRDVANTGYYLVPVEVFAPEPDGTPPAIFVVLDDLKNPAEPGCGLLPNDVVAAVWNQFRPYFHENGVDAVEATPKLRRETQAAVTAELCAAR